MEDIICVELISQSVKQMHQNTGKIIACMNGLDEQDVWAVPNEHLNSIANLILHLCGNIRQHIISSLGKTEDVRERDLEFSAHGGYTKSELNIKLQDTVDLAIAVIQCSTREELLRERITQGFMHSGIGIIIHVTEHYSYHTGQIILLTKLLKNMDLGFYSGVDLNKRNDSV
jgi:uncharacterized damage-inducible protein DinB